MGYTTGRRVTSKDNYQIDQPTISVGGTAIGIYEGDASINTTLELAYPNYAGRPGRIKGEARVVNGEATLAITGLELTQALLDDVFLTASGVPRNGLIEDAAYKTVVVEGLRSDGQKIRATLDNCLVEDGSLTVAPEPAGTWSATFATHYDPDDPNVVPWKVEVVA